MSEAQCTDRTVVGPDDRQEEEKEMPTDGPAPLELLHEGFPGGVVRDDGPDPPRPRLSRGRIALLGLAMMLTYYMGVSGAAPCVYNLHALRSIQTATVTAVTIVIPEAAADLGVDVLTVQWVSVSLWSKLR
jgi:hypothetical protein